MFSYKSLTKQKLPSERAQAMAEFAIALPVLMLVLVGIFETGRLMIIYASINNASREAVRYASAYGLNDSSRQKFRDCDAIREAGQRSVFLISVPDNNIQIEYYRPQKDGSGHDVVVSGVLSETLIDFPTGVDGVCDQGSGEDPDVSVESGDRVKVTITASYSPMLRLIPFRPRTITSVSSRTILGILKLEN